MHDLSHRWRYPLRASLPDLTPHTDHRPDPAQWDQLELGYEAPRPRRELVLEQLRRHLDDSLLSIQDFASWVLGRAPCTLDRYLRGGPVPEDQANWILRLQRVELEGELVILTLERGPIGPRWEGLRERRRLLRDMRRST